MDTTLLTSEAVSLLKQLIEIPRTSRNEVQSADLLYQKMTEQGLSPCRLENNIWSIAPGYQDYRPTLLLNAHIDTVKPVSAWTRDPFKATVEGDYL